MVRRDYRLRDRRKIEGCLGTWGLHVSGDEYGPKQDPPGHEERIAALTARVEADVRRLGLECHAGRAAS